jgi:hypothetical protein
MIVSFISAVLLVFTRYAVILTGGLLILLLLLKIYSNKNPRLVLLLLAAIGAGVLILELVGFDLILNTYRLGTHIFFKGYFYNVDYIIPNLQGYTASLLGLKGNFLWLQLPLTTAFILLPAAAFLILTAFNGTRKEKVRSISILLLFLSQLPLLLIFYTVDGRYLILTLPLLAITWGWLYAKLSVSRKLLTIIFIAVLLGLHILSYQSFIKEIISNNLLHNSTAWQYEAIQHFNSYFSNKTEKPILITALPPHLVDAYQTSRYTLLPLSKKQEFLQKGEWIWKQEFLTDNLAQRYSDLLMQGNAVYITNSYITHQQSVIADYETYKAIFKFVLVSEGCLSACNIYKISILDDVSNK